MLESSLNSAVLARRIPRLRSLTCRCCGRNSKRPESAWLKIKIYRKPSASTPKTPLGTGWSLCRLLADQRSHLLASNHAANVPWAGEVEDHNGEVVVPAEGDGGSVHHLEAALDDVQVGDLLKHGRVFHKHGIGVINAVHFGGLKNSVGLDLHGAQGGGRISRKIRIPCACGKDHNPSLFQVTDSSTTNEGLCHLVHLDS